MSDRLVFDTGTLPERHRFQAFRDEVVRRYTALDIKTQNQLQFHGAIELQRADNVDIGAFATAAATFDRAAPLVRDGDDGLIVMLCRSGIAYQTQRGYEQKLQSGEAVICDCGYAGGLHMATDSRFWSVKVPRSRLMSLLPQTDQFGGLMLEKDPLARRLLFGYLAGTYNVDFGNGGRAPRLYGDHMIDLIALALGAEGDAREFAERRSIRKVRRAAILREVEVSFADPALDPDVVAIRLGVTVRWVHALLEETGRSFTEHLLERRLARATELLRDPQLPERKIADIAFQVGFTDLSHFNRMFRRKYGMTPTELRKIAQKEHRG
jgi:AraC-like DNA-binding protein